MVDNKNKVMIVGTGNVGMSYAYALLNQRTGTDELVLVDLDNEDAEGEALDLRNGLGFTPGTMKIRSGGYKDAHDCDLVVITAGAKQAEGETRIDLLKKNAAILKPMVEEIVKSGFKGIFLLVTNPVDVMTYLTQKYSGFDYSRVIGSGTVLDTSRLMYAVGHLMDVNPKSVHGYILGEHGDSGFPAWSLLDVGLKSGMDLLDAGQRDEVARRVRDEAYRIIEKKGSTHFGIGACLAYITSVIFSNSKTILPLSNYDAWSGVYYGYPCVLSREGVTGRFGVKLIVEEQEQLDRSIGVLKKAIAEVEG